MLVLTTLRYVSYLKERCPEGMNTSTLQPPPLPAAEQRYRPAGVSAPDKGYLTKPGGQVGYIEDTTSMLGSKFGTHVLSCLTNFDVILDTKEGIHMRDYETNQKWKCGRPNENGWFLIQHPGTKKYLANKGSGQLKVEGNKIMKSLITELMCSPKQ